jgi:hypothetical protein
LKDSQPSRGGFFTTDLLWLWRVQNVTRRDAGKSLLPHLAHVIFPAGQRPQNWLHLFGAQTCA